MEPVGGKRAPGYVWWNISSNKWEPGWPEIIGHLVEDPWIANPIPANEGDSQKAESSEEWQEAGLTASMMWNVIQSMRKALDCDGTRTPVEQAERVMESIAELRATVERLTAENAEMYEKLVKIAGVLG